MRLGLRRQGARSPDFESVGLDRLLEARDRLLQEWYRQRREDLEADGRVVRYPLYLN